MRSKEKKLKGKKCDKEGGDALKKKKVGCNHILVAVVCVVGFFFIVMMVLIDSMATKATLGEAPSKILGMSLPCQSTDKCKINCSNIGEEINISALIETEYLNMDTSSCGRILKELKLAGLNVENSILRENWLDSNLFKIESLEISSKTISHIEGGAFKGRLFNTMNTITLTLDIDIWDETTLQGLDRLKELNLRQCSFREIHKNVLKPVEPSLETLQIQETKHYLKLRNITGQDVLTNLLTVDLRFNSYGLEMDSDSLKGLEFCRALHLRKSNIKHFEKGTFNYMFHLQTLDLSENQIERLNRNVFGSLQPVFKLGLSGNRWTCDCELQWVKELKINNKTEGDTICRKPCEGCDFMDVDFCGDGSNSTEESPTTTTIDSTTSESTTANVTRPVGPPSTEQQTTNNLIDSTINDNLVELYCDVGPFENNFINNGKQFPYTNVDHQIPMQTVDFEICDEAAGEVKIIVMSDITPSDLIIWFNKNITNLKIGCATNLSKSIHIKNLGAGETYSFCFLRENERKISPLNCRAHITAKTWAQQVWLSNQKKPLVLTLFVVSLLVCCIIGALLIYCLIRRNPSLLRGSKRIVFVDHKTTNAIVLPPSVKKSSLEDNDWRNKSFRPVPSRRNTPIRRSVSELSFASLRSADPSYVVPSEPTTAQLLTWRLERLRSKTTFDSPSKENNPEPPPLPPPNSRPVTIERSYSPSLLSHYETLKNVTEA